MWFMRGTFAQLEKGKEAINDVAKYANAHIE